MVTSKVQVIVNDQEIQDIFLQLENQVPTPFISFTLNTNYSDMLKKSKVDGSINPFYNELRKVQEKTYRLVTDYQVRVWNNLVKEGKDPNTFNVESPSGKKHISKSLLTDTDTETKTYLMVEWFPEIKGTTEYEYRGNSIDKTLFEKWIRYGESSNEKQGLDREVKPITPDLDNVLEISVGGNRYEIVKE